MKNLKWFELKEKDEISIQNTMDKAVFNCIVKKVYPSFIIVDGGVKGDINLHSSILEISKISKFN